MFWMQGQEVYPIFIKEVSLVKVFKQNLKTVWGVKQILGLYFLFIIVRSFNI